MTNRERLAYLFQRYLDHTETPEEWQELMELVENAENKEAIEQALDAARPRLANKTQMNNEQAERLFQVIRQQTGSTQVIAITAPRKQRIGWRVAAAAAIIGALSFGSYYLFFNHTGKPGKEVTAVPPAANDVEAPKIRKASITLADGRTVSIDSLTAIKQDNVQLIKTAEGQLVYTGNANAVTYNTLTNPRGSQVIDMTLTDGSKVWLNAGSSITYPVAFIGNERKVQIVGEAYFEVTHNVTRPFIVSKGSMEVKVLGTHFNVNAYAGEPSIKVTLLEGSVNVSVAQGSPLAARSSQLLAPNQQAIITNETLRLSKDVNIEEVMAWKNGLFEFNETDIHTIMAQIERWYDVEVVFEGDISQHFNGTIRRQVNVSQVLNMLEKTGGLRFSIEGKKVSVKKF